MRETLSREAEATADTTPSRAALLLVALARTALDVHNNPQTAQSALTKASSLAPDIRAVTLSQRWFAERLGRPADVLASARAELPHTGDVRDRTALYWQIAALQAYATNQTDAAERTLRELIALDPSDPGAWDALATLCLRQKQWQHVATAWEALASHTQDTALRAALYAAAATVREVPLNDTEGARTDLLQALECDPNHPSALAALEPIALRARTWMDYARVMVRQGDQVGDPASARECYERAGDVLWECIHDGASAAACYERAAIIAPREISPLEKYAEVLESTGRYADLPRVYERMLQVLRDPVEQATVLYQLGTIYETRLDRPDEAIRAHRRALETMPTFVAAAQALSALYRSQHKFEELAALERTEADRIAHPAQRAARYVTIAELYETTLGNTDEAIALYEHALTLDPAQTTAFDALDRLYRAREQWDALIALHEKILAHTRDPRRARAIQRQLAALVHDRTRNPQRAAQLYRPTLGGEQDELPTLMALARAYAEAGMWTEYVQTLEAQTKLLRDDGDLVATLYRIAVAIENHLADPRRALMAYTKVLERAPRHEAALRAIGRIHQSQGRWEDVISTERKLLELYSRPEDAAIALHRIARIAEDRLARPDEAIKAYEEALLRLGTYSPARLALERLLRTTQRHSQLATLYERQAETSRDPTLKARLLARAANVYELHLGDPARATTLYERALTAAADNDTALWGLARLYELRGQWQALEKTLQSLLAKTTHSGARLRWLVRLGRVLEWRLGAPTRAAQCYEEAINCGTQGVSLSVDRLRVARIEGQQDTISHWLEHIANNTHDGRLSLGLLRQRALLAEYGTNTPQQAAEIYARALIDHPDDAQALEGLARNVARIEGDQRLPATLAARARLLSDTSTRALLLYLAGAIMAQRGQTNEAEALYTEALEAQSDFLPAIDGLRQLRQAAGDWTTVAALWARAATVMAHPDNVIHAHLQAGQILMDRVNDPQQALNHFRAVLNLQPGHEHAFARAAQVLEALGDSAGFVEIARAHAEALTNPIARAHVLVTRARVLADTLGKLPAAIADVEQALSLRPDEPSLLEIAARLHERAQHWQDAAQTYDRLARTVRQGPVYRMAILAQAQIWTERVKDYHRARTLLEQLVHNDPDDRTALTRLAEATLRCGDTTRAKELYEHLGRTGTSVERAQALLALSEVHRTTLGDLASSHKAGSEAFALATMDPAVTPVLDEHYSQTEDWGAFATLGEEALSRAPSNAPGTLALRMSLARVYRDRLRIPDRADQHLRAAVEAFPQATEPRLALAYGLLGGNDHAAVIELRRVIDLDPTCVPAFRGLLTVCTRAGLHGAAALMASAVSLLGDRDGQVEAALSLSMSPQPLAGALDADTALQLLVGPTRARYFRRVITVLDPHLHEIFPAGQESLAALTRLPETYPAVTFTRAVAASLGVTSLGIFRSSHPHAAVVLSAPRALVLGPEHLTDRIEGSTARLLFDAAHACALIAAASVAAVTVPPEQLLAVMEVTTDSTADGPGYRELRKRVHSILPRRARKELERIAEEEAGDLRREWPAWEEEERKRALRAGVVFCRDLRTVARVFAPDALTAHDQDTRRRLLASNAAMIDALRFSASEACWSALRRVYGQA